MRLVFDSAIGLFFIFAVACSWEQGRAFENSEEDYFIVFLVDAPGFDYSSNRALLNSILDHRGEFGHAWIRLEGWKDNSRYILECGHSGERGIAQAKYFDGIMNYQFYGHPSPTCQQKKTPCYEPNPVKYLWAAQRDGFCQKGSGGHTPTSEAKFPLTKEEFDKIVFFIENLYPFSSYSITQNQCCTFVAQVAALAGIELEYKVSMPIEPRIWYRGMVVRLWEDSKYSSITFGSPDRLEQSLKDKKRPKTMGSNNGVTMSQWGQA